MIFVDTSFFAALLLPKDANHTRAVQAIEDLGSVRLSEVLLTTNKRPSPSTTTSRTAS